jgi:cytochrome c peroxidase
MMNQRKGQYAEPPNQQGDIPTSKRPSSRCGPLLAALVVSLSCGGIAAAQGTSPTQLRQFIDQQVGGIAKLMVPAQDADLPQPRLANGSPDPFFQTTEAKRYLGQQLFHDPVRMVRIDPMFGGVPATAQSASCTSCHLCEAATKAGTLLNFAVGGEGRHYTDAAGNFIPRRRPRVDILPKLRNTPLFPGDALVDSLPTLTDIYQTTVGIVIGSPALGRKLAAQNLNPVLIQTGRLDALDSVARNAPGVIGAAFNNRLLLDGFAGEPDASPGGLNPFGHPAQENVTLLLLDAHRLLGAQSAVLEQIRTYRQLFRDAFPDEAAQAPNCSPQPFTVPPGTCGPLINDITVLRATATFLRTTVTRNTPWDQFLAGSNGALTEKQRRGAKLFFTAADKGGAGCYSCHSGPMLNKQVNDPDLAGVGQFVEENFYNLGLGDHPVQALNRAARMDPSFRDEGRKDITGRGDDVFKFRVLTLRQLKDARFFFHSGAFTSVKDVVQYFNAGVPQDAQAGAAVGAGVIHLLGRDLVVLGGNGAGRAGIEAEISTDIRRTIWEKFVFLVGLSGTTTCIRMPIGPIRSNPRTRALLHDAMREVVAVGRAQGVQLAEDFADDRLAFSDGLPTTMTSSMHNDLERGNRLEVDGLSGDVVQRGRAAGVPTPVNRAIYDILILHAAGQGQA